MNPRQVMKIVQAALHWNAARARRLAAGSAKRRADEECKGVLFLHPPGHARQRAAAEALSRAKRQELAAARALSALCPPVHVDLPEADVIEGVPMLPGSSHEQ